MPQDYLGLPSVGYGWKESLTIPGGVWGERASLNTGEVVGLALLPACFDYRSGGFGGLPRFYPVSQGLVCSGFLLTTPCSRRRPDAGLGLGFDWSCFGCVVILQMPRTLLWFLLPLLTFLD